MKQDFDVRAGDAGSMDKYYSGNDQDYRCVGHIRGDFGKSGDEYWATFWEHEGINLAEDCCKDELECVSKFGKMHFRHLILHFSVGFP